MEIGKCKVISVKSDAVKELLFETLIEKKSMFFQLGSKNTTEEDIMLEMKLDDESGDLICAVFNFCDHHKVDLDTIKKSIGYTTDTFFKKKRHMLYSLDMNKVIEEKRKYRGKRIKR